MTKNSRPVHSSLARPVHLVFYRYQLSGTLGNLLVSDSLPALEMLVLIFNIESFNLNIKICFVKLIVVYEIKSKLI